MTPAQTRHYIRETIKSLGGPAKIAAKLNISEGHVRAVYERCIHPGPKTMSILGLRRDRHGEYHQVK